MRMEKKVESRLLRTFSARGDTADVLSRRPLQLTEEKERQSLLSFYTC